MDSELPSFLVWSLCIKCLVHHEVYSVSWSCLLSFLCNPYIPFQIYEIFYLLVYIYISYVRHFWSRGPRATRKRKPAHLKFKGHMHACCIVANASRAITTLIERLHMYSSSLITSSAGWKLRLHLKERSVYSSSLQHRLEAETTHEREERLQQLSAAQVRS